MTDDGQTYTAFAGEQLLVSDGLETMLARVKEHVDGGGAALIFEDETGRQIDFDFRGTLEDVIGRVTPAKRKAGPGRPRLGVVSREVSLLPRHWQWLEQQRVGMSGALRRLVDEARKREPGRERGRRARDAAGAFMWGMAGDLPGFEEASRALYAEDDQRLEALVSDWPPDIRAHLLGLVGRAARFAAADGTSKP